MDIKVQNEFSYERMGYYGERSDIIRPSQAVVQANSYPAVGKERHRKIYDSLHIRHRWDRIKKKQRSAECGPEQWERGKKQYQLADAINQ